VLHAGPPGPLPASHALLRPAQLVADAEAAAAAVAALLRAPGVDQLSGPLRIVAVKVAGSLAARRPRFLGRLLPPLLVLAKAAASQVLLQTPAPDPLVCAVWTLTELVCGRQCPAACLQDVRAFL